MTAGNVGQGGTHCGYGAGGDFPTAATVVSLWSCLLKKKKSHFDD